MSVIVNALQSAAVQVAIALTATDGAEFDADKVTPGPEGFIATAVFAVAVIVLGFLLVSRIRRSRYRHEAREQIAAELAEQNGVAGPGSTARPGDGSAADGRDTPGA